MAVDREAFANWVWEWIMSIEYTTNVKGHIDQGDSNRHNALMDVWSAMMKLQRPPAKKEGSWQSVADFHKHGGL